MALHAGLWVVLELICSVKLMVLPELCAGVEGKILEELKHGTLLLGAVCKWDSYLLPITTKSHLCNEFMKTFY